MLDPAGFARRARCRHTCGHKANDVPGRELVVLSVRTDHPNERILLVAQFLPARSGRGDG